MDTIVAAHGLALLTGSILDWIFGDPIIFPI